MTSRWLMDEIRERSIAAKRKAMREAVRRQALFGQRAMLSGECAGLRYWLKTNKPKGKRSRPND